ncbi:MAG: hypothetical protein HQL52_13335 [Magnetococcales bacterium]|nr:hypothetical protein [Magnetococcales bacterium]
MNGSVNPSQKVHAMRMTIETPIAVNKLPLEVRQGLELAGDRLVRVTVETVDELTENGFTPEEEAEIIQSYEEAKRGINVSPGYETIEEALAALDRAAEKYGD